MNFEQGFRCVAVLTKHRKVCAEINRNQSIKVPEKINFVVLKDQKINRISKISSIRFN